MILQSPKVAREFIFTTKSCLLMLQTLLVIVLLITREEYIYRGVSSKVSTSNDIYKNAEIEIIIVTILFFIFLSLEFFTILLGISTKFMKICSFQILLHIWGVLFTTFLIIDRFHYRYILLI